MVKQNIVHINGRAYDAKTGLPVASEHTSRAALRSSKAPTETAAPINNVDAPKKPVRATQAAQSKAIHRHTQKSTTLNRTFAKKPTATPKIVRSSKRPSLDGMRRVASKPVTTPSKKPLLTKTSVQLAPAHALAPKSPLAPTPKTTKQDAAVRPHPVAARAHKVQAARKQQVNTIASQKTAPQTQPAAPASHSIVQRALENAPSPHDAKPYKQSRTSHRFAGILFGCMALVLFGGYVTYLNVPNISVRVAAAQAGIDASYPGYQPDGYKLNGPVAYSDGQVRMKFAANTGSTSFALKQKKSSWDSSALLDNYVKQKSDDDYSTSQEKGLTIYNYGSNAAWVSGGIIYTIEGDAPLSPDQIRRIATSI